MKILMGLLVITLFASCTSNHAGNQTGNHLKDSIAQHIHYPDTPDFAKHIKPLFSFFAQNQHLPAFDTGVYFDDQGFGPVDNYYNFIQAGHIFSKIQYHAVVFYDFAVKNYGPLARLLIYKRNVNDNAWHQVLDDTTEVVSLHYKYKDWNCDGIADLSCVNNGWDHGGHGPISWHLWLVDKQGIPHAIKGFEDLDDPQIDSFTHHIFSNQEDRSGEQIAEYKFNGDSIVKVSDDMSFDYETPNIVTYYRDNKIIKKVKRKNNSPIYTPKYDERDY